MKYKIDYAKVEYYARVEVEADTLEEAQNKLYGMEEDGLLQVVNSGQHYIKIYDENSNVLRDTQDYLGWSLIDVESEVEDMIAHREDDEDCIEVIEKLKALSEKDINDILRLFCKYADFSEIREYQLQPIIEKYIGED